MLPPISVPHPTSAPFITKFTASPPEDPPGVNVLSRGLSVLPKILFSVSHHMMLCGRLVFAIKTAPRRSRICTSTEGTS